MPKLKKLDLSFNKLNYDKIFDNNKIGGNKTHSCKYCEIKKKTEA